MKNTAFTLIFCLLLNGVHAQFFKDNKNVTKYNGYLSFYYDDSSDKIYLEIDKLDHEFLYIRSLSEGLGSNDIGLDRGQLGSTAVVKFQKAGNKILLIQPNQTYRALTNNSEERKSIEQAFAKSVLHGFVIDKEEKGKYLVDATSFFMRDAHGVAERLEQNEQGTYKLDKTKSAFSLDRTKAFPKNVEFDIMLTFTGKPKGFNIMSVWHLMLLL